MKQLALALLLATLSCHAQTPVQNLYALGGSYNPNAQPSVAGTFMGAHYVAAPGSYAFMVVDVVPTAVKPFTPTENMGVGIAQRMFTIANVSLFMPTSAGVGWTGANVGWQYTGGAALEIGLKHNFCLVPTVRFLKSSVGGSGFQPVFGLNLGFGK
jgi:hypothetical protein